MLVILLCLLTPRLQFDAKVLQLVHLVRFYYAHLLGKPLYKYRKRLFAESNLRSFCTSARCAGSVLRAHGWACVREGLTDTWSGVIA
eukprot:1426550-Pyramimonas_sp.AAC.1